MYISQTAMLNGCNMMNMQRNKMITKYVHLKSASEVYLYDISFRTIRLNTKRRESVKGQSQ